MKIRICHLLSVVVATSVMGLAAGFADDTKKDTKSEKPKATPGWVVIEEDFWYPWRFKALDQFHKAQVHFRQHEERSAARELKSAATWLEFAAKHGSADTETSLTDTVKTLRDLAEKLHTGKPVASRALDDAMLSSNLALSEWHYYHVDSKLAQGEINDAVTNLKAAVRYLDSAAKSARYEYGSETVTVIDTINSWDETVDVNPNELEGHLKVIKKEIDTLAKELKSDE